MSVAQELVDMVNPLEEGEISKQTLLGRLLGAPQKVASFLTEAPAVCVRHALTFVKSFWPKARDVRAGSGGGVY
jgi:hypothetical protein